MKLALFVALALVVTGVSAQDIEVKSELRLNGKVIEQFAGSKPNGQPQIFSSLKNVPYKQAASQTEGGKVKTTTGYYQTGFYMEILPTLRSDGTILYVLNVSHEDMKTVPQKVGDVEVESPTGWSDKFIQSMVVNQGEAREINFSSTEDVSPSSITKGLTKHYVLSITATALKN
jgi:hypothetical protein